MTITENNKSECTNIGTEKCNIKMTDRQHSILHESYTNRYPFSNKHLSHGGKILLFEYTEAIITHTCNYIVNGSPNCIFMRNLISLEILSTHPVY